jgi:hypothetical protein
MTDKEEQVLAAIPTNAPGVRNLGEPLRFKDVEPFAGFSAEPAQTGQTVKIWTQRQPQAGGYGPTRHKAR